MSELLLNLLPVLGVMFISSARTLAVILLLHTLQPEKSLDPQAGNEVDDINQQAASRFG